MTIILASRNAGKSKAALLEALTNHPCWVYFEDPSIINPRAFTGEDIKPGERFPVVMDHPRRMRFAQVQRKADGTFRVF